MPSPSKAVKRPYDNKLRAGRAAQTRAAILEALCEELSDGSLNELSVARIAKRAGVSEPTVYRHFPNRAAMFDALQAHVDDKFDFPEPMDVERGGEDLARFAEELFVAFEAQRELVRGFLVARLGQEWTARQRQLRTQRMADDLAKLTAGLPDKEARAVTAVIRYLHSARTWKAFADEFEMDGREAGEAVAWALRALLAEVERMKDDA